MIFIKEGDFYLNEGDKIPYLIASSNESSLRHDEHINEKLRKLSYKGEVYINMLLTKGASPTRFMECYFNGNNFEISKTKVLNLKSKIVYEYLRNIEKHFCNEYTALIENSILSYSEKQIAYGNNC